MLKIGIIFVEDSLSSEMFALGLGGEVWVSSLGSLSPPSWPHAHMTIQINVVEMKAIECFQAL